jgi:glycosidase
MMNLLGSHDTQRIRHLAHDDFSRIRYAVFFQMTFVGVPHIYYGDEIGMDGGKDPDNRRPFDWDWQQNTQAVKLRDFYKRLILMRKNNPVLIDGEFRFVESRPGLLLYDRYYDDLCLRCAINYSQEDRVLGKTGEILFTEGDVMHGAEGMILASQAMCIIKK